jgi:hypothetical protein
VLLPCPQTNLSESHNQHIFYKITVENHETYQKNILHGIKSIKSVTIILNGNLVVTNELKASTVCSLIMDAFSFEIVL